MGQAYPDCLLVFLVSRRFLKLAMPAFSSARLSSVDFASVKSSMDTLRRAHLDHLPQSSLHRALFRREILELHRLRESRVISSLHKTIRLGYFNVAWN